MKNLIFIVALFALMLSACGAPAAPTLDPVLVQASAMAAANTMIAMTQAAIPTSTPVPPATDTPQVLPSPTLDLLAGFPTAGLPTATAGAGTETCVHPLDMNSAGPKHTTVIRNESGGTINISLNLWKINSFGQCGAISFANMGKNSTEEVGLPTGYWFAYAWATIKSKQVTMQGNFYVQPAQFDKLELCVRPEGIIVYKPQC